MAVEPVNPELLRDAGEALYGALWQSPLARDLNVAVRTMQRWAAGEFAIPATVAKDLLRLVKARGVVLERLAKQLAR